MSKVLINDTTLTDMANVVREKTKTNNKYKPSEMVEVIKNLSQDSMNLESFMRLSDLLVRYSSYSTRRISEKDYTQEEVVKTQNLLNILGGV